MKKVSLAILLLLSATIVFSQKGQQVIGLQAGAFFREGKANGHSGSGGVFYSYNFSNRLGAEAALTYRQESREEVFEYYMFAPDFSYSRIEYSSKAKFLEVPFSLRVILN